MKECVEGSAAPFFSTLSYDDEDDHDDDDDDYAKENEEEEKSSTLKLFKFSTLR